MTPFIQWHFIKGTIAAVTLFDKLQFGILNIDKPCLYVSVHVGKELNEWSTHTLPWSKVDD